MAEAYDLYRDKGVHPDAPQAAGFRQAHAREVRVRFVGVWDTVGALGIPLSAVPFSRDYYQWHDTELSKIVDFAFHAIATDEHRLDFDVTEWSRIKPGNVQVEQRWFVGAHSDVGGGAGGSALSRIALRRIQDQAEMAGLALKRKVEIGPRDHLAPIEDSYGDFVFGLYRLFRRRHFRAFGAGANETVDESVWRRWREDPAYRPPSLRSHPQRPAEGAAGALAPEAAP